MSLLLAAGCSTSLPEPQLHSVVDGRWSTACLPRQDLFASYLIQLDFQNAQDVTRTESYAVDANCEATVATLQYRGSYELIVTGRDFIYAIDFAFDGQSLEAVNPLGQKLLEETAFCGQSSWPLAAPLNPLTFEPESCTAVGPTPLSHLNLVAINRGFSLNFGTDVDHDNERPVDVVLAPQLVFLSQPSP